MKYTAILLLTAMMCTICSCQKLHPQSKKDAFRKQEDAKFKKAAAELVKMGHMAPEGASDIYMLVGHYDWYGDGDGYFGAYSYYPPAFEQAKRGWFMHGEVLEGSNEFWPQDDWDTPNQRNIIKFDNSIIGYTLPRMSMFWFKDGKEQMADFTAKIIGIEENGHTLILDRTAPHHAEQWGMAIVPDDWRDMCACTMGPGDNSGALKFSNGQPVANAIPDR